MKRALLFVLVACGGPELVEPPVMLPPQQQPENPQPQNPQPITGVPCDVQAALQANCGGCHAGQAYAPHFVTREDLVTAGTKLTERMVDVDRPMPPLGARRQPSIAERGLISGWVEQGMPGGNCGGVTR
jgi:hypothetical protein